MRITVTLESGEHVGTNLGPVVEVATPCPVCGQRTALVDQGGVVRMLALQSAVPSALREAAVLWGPCTMRNPPATLQVQLLHPVEVRGPDHATGKDHTAGVDGDAECARCRAVVGRMAVRFETIFGAEEDEAVLNGRPRVYDGVDATTRRTS